jgi:hypothetical protein
MKRTLKEQILRKLPDIATIHFILIIFHTLRPRIDKSSAKQNKTSKTEIDSSCNKYCDYSIF